MALTVAAPLTRLAVYPSMKTALRTYHPIPSLQKDELSQKDLQDAPRIKGILKACYLDWEVGHQPNNLKDIAKKAAELTLIQGPPTTVVTAIFNLFNEAGLVSKQYFPPGHDLLDIFYPSQLSAASRATAFLSLLSRVLESGPAFLDDFAAPHPVPLNPPIALTPLGPDDPAEDADPPDELQFAADMRVFRNSVVKDVPAILARDQGVAEREAKKQEREEAKAEGTPGVGGPGAGAEGVKRRRIGVRGSFARRESRKRQQENKEILPDDWETNDFVHEVPLVSSLPGKSGFASPRPCS